MNKIITSTIHIRWDLPCFTLELLFCRAKRICTLLWIKMMPSIIKSEQGRDINYLSLYNCSTFNRDRWDKVTLLLFRHRMKVISHFFKSQIIKL